MFRVIFTSDNKDYQTFDTLSKQKAQQKKQELMQLQILVVCIVCYDLSCYLYRDDTFELHRDHIEDLVFGDEHDNQSSTLHTLQVKF